MLTFSFIRSHLPALAACFLLVLANTGCEKLGPQGPAPENLLDGPVEGLTSAEMRRFLKGDEAFNNHIFSPEMGLGPAFVATSCGGCHAGDGKGHPSSMLTRFGQNDTTGNTWMAFGAPQLQNRAIGGLEGEKLPEGAPFSRFLAPANTGLGFLEALNDEQILAHADPHDADGDGISGRPNYLVAPPYFQPLPIHKPLNGRYIGRFGKKAGSIDLFHQTVKAYQQDMGITSTYLPAEPAFNGNPTPGQYQPADPEVSNNTIAETVFYLRTLKAPPRRDKNQAEVLQGEALFETIGCSKCHISTYTTGQSDVNALAYKTFHPYTDLLLHDMGSGLDDGYTEGAAKTAEWRTAPLWGLGLAQNSQGGQIFLLHDGRAHSIRQAIEMHGGEAEATRVAYQSLPATEQVALIRFLQSL